MDDPIPIDAPAPQLNHYRCTSCFGIVGTEYTKEELTCVCGGVLEDIAGQVVEKKGKK